MKRYSFEDLKVWQSARALTLFVYRATRSFPGSERLCIVDQMRRAAISVCSNLAEGSSRTTGKDKARFTAVAYGSLMELLNQIIISHDLGYLEDSQVKEARLMIDDIAAKAGRLRNVQLNEKKV
jgi:four helix bundle protein